jgi:hypothetical protein
VEKTIALPKNQALGNAKFPDLVQSRFLPPLLLQQQWVSFEESILGNVASAYQQALGNLTRSESSASTVQDRSFEPSTALVDGLYCLEYLLEQNAVEKKSGQKSPGWFHSFFTFFKKSTKTTCTQGQDHTFEYQEPSMEQKQTMHFNDAHVGCHLCPEVTESLPNPSPFSVEDDDLPRFYLPFIYVENKRATKSLHQALHQCQMYCIFGVEFLAVLGITDFPVFGVVTAATEGEIIMAWKSSKPWKTDYSSWYRTMEVSFRHFVI